MKATRKLFLVTAALIITIGLLTTNTSAHSHSHSSLINDERGSTLLGMSEVEEMAVFHEDVKGMSPSEGNKAHQSQLSRASTPLSLITSLVNQQLGGHCDLCGGGHPYAHSIVCGSGADCIQHLGTDCRKDTDV